MLLEIEYNIFNQKVGLLSFILVFNYERIVADMTVIWQIKF